VCVQVWLTDGHDRRGWSHHGRNRQQHQVIVIERNADSCCDPVSRLHHNIFKSIPGLLILSFNAASSESVVLALFSGGGGLWKLIAEPRIPMNSWQVRSPPLTAKTSSTKTKQKHAAADSSELLMADNDR
jgi:hypothetical protein